VRSQRHPHPDVDGGKAFCEGPGIRRRGGARSRAVRVMRLITSDFQATRTELGERGGKVSAPSHFGAQG
jgi:hypothetical protein